MSKTIIDIPIDFTIKAVDDNDEVLQIEGFANTTTVDRVGDIILEEAWTKGGLDNYLKNPIILAYHNHSRPIGKMVNYAVNNKGLQITAEIIKSAGEVYSLIKSGVLKTFSVGFRTTEADYDTDTDLFVIKDLELMEVSVVSIPANADSIFSVKKSFETDEEYTSFKAEFIVDTNTAIADKGSNNDSDKEEKIMPQTQAEIEADLRAKIEKEITDEAARKADLAKEVTSVVETQMKGTVETVTDQVENLKKDIEGRLTDDSKTMQEALEAIQADIKEYAEELQTLNKASKMSFKDKSKGTDDLAVYTESDIDTAIIVSKVLGRPIADTKFGLDLLEKSDGQHHTALTEDWEASFSMRLWDDIREKLIVENLFRVINMPTVTLHLPLNPEAGYGTWVTTAQMNAATSSGTTRIHSPEDISITAHKLATKELLGYEEEDDSLIALVPLIRDASIRRMAKSSDKALLIGSAGVSAGTGEGLYPFEGIAEIGINDANTTQIAGTLASPTAVDVTILQAMRRSMGVHGHNPNDLVYVVNHDVYYDLLEDTDFRTMDLVGDKATILTGQVGAVAGTPVIVSGEFETAADTAAAVCVNMSNYLKGEYKGLRVERERSVEFQTNLLVVTRRFGMIELFPANPTVHTLINPSS